MLSSLFGSQFRRAMLGFGRVLAGTGISPNTITWTGLVLNAVVGLILASGSLVFGGLMTLVAGLFDMLDGAVARAGGRASVFGSFLDSTLDRYSEALLLLGLLVYFARDHNTLAMFLVYATMVGSIMTSYTRARAEAVGLKNDAGLFQRTERVVLLGLLLVFRLPVLAVWVLAVCTNLTAAYRVYAVYRTTRT
ncbi:MAG: CDP-alcohol phosphatidyltransferase family protein [Chloroflexota bacterium]|nr:CDP-alcohol phosphatidyltransferase family protein [Chloroflexota bacterium]